LFIFICPNPAATIASLNLLNSGILLIIGFICLYI
jgi:hypothetical protein